MKLALGLLLVIPALLRAESAPFLDVVTQHFPAWDANGNGALSLAEVDRAIDSPAVSGDAAAAAAALRRGLRAGKLEVIALPEVAAKLSARRADKKAVPDFEGGYEFAQKRLVSANRKLYANLEPQPRSLRQGKLGDCFCLAALRTLLHRDPAAIKSMISPLADGSYTVELGAKKVPVPALTDGEIALGASTADGLWPLVYEKAVGISRMKPDAKDATAFSVVTKGGSAGGMMSVLTAHEIKRWSCKTWREAKADAAKQAELLNNLRSQLTEAFRDGRLVTGGTDSPAAGKKGPPGITFNHGYAVLGYNAANDTVRLWNPHGDEFKPKGAPGLTNGYPETKGEFDVSLSELVTFFGGFAVEQR